MQTEPTARLGAAQLRPASRAPRPHRAGSPRPRPHLSPLTFDPSPLTPRAPTDSVSLARSLAPAQRGPARPFPGQARRLFFPAPRNPGTLNPAPSRRTGLTEEEGEGPRSVGLRLRLRLRLGLRTAPARARTEAAAAARVKLGVAASECSGAHARGAGPSGKCSSAKGVVGVAKVGRGRGSRRGAGSRRHAPDSVGAWSARASLPCLRIDLFLQFSGSYSWPRLAWRPTRVLFWGGLNCKVHQNRLSWESLLSS